MLRSVFFILVSSFVFASLQAQVGIRAGGNFATQRFEEDRNVDTEADLGFVAGLFFEIPVSTRFSIQPELLYVQKGVDTRAEILGDIFESGLDLDYLEVPLNAKFKLPGEKLSGYLLGGPTFGYAVAGEVYVDTFDASEDVDWDLYERFDIGANLGGGIAFPLNSGTLSLDIRYLLGLTDTDSANQFEAYNRGVMITVGYQL